MSDLFTTSKLDLLRANLDRLSPRDRDFATSMLAQHGARGSLSEKQWAWVDTLNERATAPAEARKTEAVGEMAGVMALFAKAEMHLKFPAVVLEVPGVGEIRLNVAGEQSSAPGSVNVTSNGSYGERTWFGRIHANGVFEHSRRAEAPAGVMEKLRDFAARPAEVAAEYGRMTGNCCFCATKLTDERSTAVGYGPTCARNWGLPWGARQQPTGADLFTCSAA